MQALAVAEALKIGKDGGSSFNAGCKVVPIQAFGLELTPKTFHRCIIEAVVGTTEADLNAELLDVSHTLAAALQQPQCFLPKFCRIDPSFRIHNPDPFLPFYWTTLCVQSFGARSVALVYALHLSFASHVHRLSARTAG